MDVSYVFGCCMERVKGHKDSGIHDDNDGDIQTMRVWNSRCQTVEPSLIYGYVTGTLPVHSDVKPSMELKWDKAS